MIKRPILAITQMQVRRKGVKEATLEDVYHRLMKMSWSGFFTLMLAIYVLMNAAFAVLYRLDPTGIAGISDGDFFSYFAFSVHNVMHTGAGLFFTATLTGLVFAKFRATR